MQEDTGLEWDQIDQSTLEEVKKSWAHSRCREVDFDVTVSVCVCVCVCAHVCTYSQVYYFPWSMTPRILCVEAQWMQP